MRIVIETMKDGSVLLRCYENGKLIDCYVVELDDPKRIERKVMGWLDGLKEKESQP